MGNHLAGQGSPYLLQHAENPVDWYPWCGEAFEKAVREDKPVFLSIGYSTCHWCHVMERESFENQEIADILNRHFVSVKVDREERPDIDSVYMSVCQALTGSGGWPMSIFLTPDRKPFFAGTYFPPAPQHGMAGFADLLQLAADRWENGREELLRSAEAILAQAGAESRTGDAGANASAGQCAGKADGSLPGRAAAIFARSFDRQYGGFGPAPKFPVPHNLLFLMLYAQVGSPGKETVWGQVRLTLDKMRRGGIFDHIGFGFSRYSTDRYYLAPHFEKMLYDNALLILAYAAAYKGTGESVFLDTAEKTAAYILREMTGPEGEFYSAQDADSEGEEGRFYLWDAREIERVLGKEKGKRFCSYYGITEEGNFEGRNIPNLLNGNEISGHFEEERELLYEYRKTRCRLHLDDKTLTAWNALTIAALAVLYRVTGKEKYLGAAERAQQFIEKNLACGKILYVGCRKGIRAVKGFLDDYAYYGAALLCLYGASGKEECLKRAEEICAEGRRQFADEACGGYFLYGPENEGLIMRPKETYDGALPSGNSVMAYCLVRLSQLTDEEGYKRLAERQLAFLSGEAGNNPAGHSMFLTALLTHFSPPWKITVVKAGAGAAGEAEGTGKAGRDGASGGAGRGKGKELHGPGEAGTESGDGAIMKALPLYADVRILEGETEEYKMRNGKTTYYVCRDYACLPPSNEIPDACPPFSDR